MNTIFKQMLAGRDVVITKKDKLTLGKVESAFLKDETDVYNLSFKTEKSIKIKIEIDTKPFLEFQTEFKRLNNPCNIGKLLDIVLPLCGKNARFGFPEIVKNKYKTCQR